MVSILLSYWEGLFSGAMLVSGGYLQSRHHRTCTQMQVFVHVEVLVVSGMIQLMPRFQKEAPPCMCQGVLGLFFVP